MNKLLEQLASAPLPGDEPETGTQADEIPQVWQPAQFEKSLASFNRLNAVKTKLSDTKSMLMRQFNAAFDFWNCALAGAVDVTLEIKNTTRDQAELFYASTGEKKIVDPILTVSEVKTVDFGSENEKDTKQAAIRAMLLDAKWYLDQIGIELPLSIDMRKYPGFLAAMEDAPAEIRARLPGKVKIVGQTKFHENKLPDLEPIPVTPTEEYELYQAAQRFANMTRPEWLDVYDPAIDYPADIPTNELPPEHPKHAPTEEVNKEGETFEEWSARISTYLWNEYQDDMAIARFSPFEAWRAALGPETVATRLGLS